MLPKSWPESLVTCLTYVDEAVVSMKHVDSSLVPEICLIASPFSLEDAQQSSGISLTTPENVVASPELTKTSDQQMAHNAKVVLSAFGSTRHLQTSENLGLR